MKHEGIVANSKWHMHEVHSNKCIYVFGSACRTCKYPGREPVRSANTRREVPQGLFAEIRVPVYLRSTPAAPRWPPHLRPHTSLQHHEAVLFAHPGLSWVHPAGGSYIKVAFQFLQRDPPRVTRCFKAAGCKIAGLWPLSW